MVSVTWKGTGGYIEGRMVFDVTEHTTGWFIYAYGDRFDDVPYPDAEAARKAAEAAFDRVLPLPQPEPRRERRRYVRNRWTEWAPHPGTLRRPPKS